MNTNKMTIMQTTDTTVDEKQISLYSYARWLNIPQRHISDEILTERLYRLRYLWTKIDARELFYKIKREIDVK